MDDERAGAAHYANAGLIGAYLTDLHRELSLMSGGEVATYIPELAKANPRWLGLAIATADGAVYAVGDVDTPFTIQSVSKPFLYGLALETLGREATLKKVGVEPTGEAFNSAVLDEANNRPHNPMVNAGAIAVSALVQGESQAAKMAAMRALFERYAGRPLTIDAPTFQSEKDTGDRNRMIADLMAKRGMIEGDISEILDLYFSQCSVLVTCRDLALMAASLANGGVNPRTGVRAIAAEHVHDVLTVMNSCGMYNYAGQWSYEVGVPAKSGVSGSITAVIPGQIGIAAFSPPLDQFGNSVRAIAACKRIAEDFGLHAFRTSPRGLGVIRAELSGASVHSKRTRTPREREVLVQKGARIRIFEAQGALFFGSAERLARRIEQAQADADYIVLDLKRANSMDMAARAIVGRLARRFQDRDTQLLFAHFPTDAAPDVLPSDSAALLFADRDAALEYCEDAVLSAHGYLTRPQAPILEEIDLLRGLSASDLKRLQKISFRAEYKADDVIFQEGDDAEYFYVIMQGAASVRLRISKENIARWVRVATAGVGSTIGDMALFSGGKRSADVVADEPTICMGYKMADVQKLAKGRPQIMHTLLANVARDLAARLRAANAEIRSLEQ